MDQHVPDHGEERDDHGHGREGRQRDVRGEFQTGLSHPDYDPYTDYGLTATNPRSNVHANYPANDTDTKTHYLVQADMSNQNLKWTGTIAVPADVNTAVVLNVNKSVPDLNTDNGPSAVNSVGLPRRSGVATSSSSSCT